MIKLVIEIPKTGMVEFDLDISLRELINHVNLITMDVNVNGSVIYENEKDKNVLHIPNRYFNDYLWYAEHVV